MDALLSMRLEKGFLHVGSDTDGTTVPDDVGWGKVAANKKGHFIGKRSLTLSENVRPDRLQIIGLAGIGAAALFVGSHLRLPNSSEATNGWITSAGMMSTDGKPVAMAMLRAGRNQMNKIVTVHDNGGIVATARVVAPVFYDPSGARMNA
jgi:sarcosine oxidase subunit alpha